MKLIRSKFKVIIFSLLLFVVIFAIVYAATNIVRDVIPTYNQWAYNSAMGFIDFYVIDKDVSGGVTVNDTNLRGWAHIESVVGAGIPIDAKLFMDCNDDNHPDNNPDTCLNIHPPTPNSINYPTNGPYGISNDIAGNLAGWAWSKAYGWVSFCGYSDIDGTGKPVGSVWNTDHWECPAPHGTETGFYQVKINPINGDFGGTALAMTPGLGSIYFNCTGGAGNPCSNSPSNNAYKVKTTWQPTSGGKYGELISSVFNNVGVSGIIGGAKINSIMWNGDLPNGAAVKFQIASSNCSNGKTNPDCNDLGDWTYEGGDSGWYSDIQNKPIAVKLDQHNNKKYFRYKIRLEANLSDQTPIVKDIIINWSP